MAESELKNRLSESTAEFFSLAQLQRPKNISLAKHPTIQTGWNVDIRCTMTSIAAKVDRQMTTPFLLRLFYKEGSFPLLADFNSNLPPHIEIYTWQTCTLRELSHLLVLSIPEFLPDPAIATRLGFRLIYSDTRSISSGPSFNSSSQGRFLSKDIGSVVVGDGGPGVFPADEEAAKIVAGGPLAGRVGGDPEVMLKDARFVIGDYIAVAVLPPLINGNIAPMLNSGPAPGVGMGRGGRVTRPGDMEEEHHFSGGSAGRLSGPRENGFGGFRVRGRGWGGPPGGGGSRNLSLPSGEWRRGERLPEGPPGTGGRGGFGGGRGRERW